MEYPRSISGVKYIFVRKSVFFGYELKLLISTAGGSFHFITVQGRHLFKETTFTVSTLPRAWLEPRANRMLVMKALRQDVAILAFHPYDALRGLKAHAIPANVFGGSSNRSPRSRRLLFQSTMQCFEQRKIIYLMVRIINKLKHL